MHLLIFSYHSLLDVVRLIISGGYNWSPSHNSHGAKGNERGIVGGKKEKTDETRGNEVRKKVKSQANIGWTGVCGGTKASLFQH